jgi:hypothetical protein
MRIDPDTATQVRRLLWRARMRGLDPVTLLDEAGLLNHSARWARDRSSAVKAAADTIANMSVLQLCGGVPSQTPADMRRWILHHLNVIAEQERRQA